MKLTAAVEDQLRRAIERAAGREVCGYIAQTDDGEQTLLGARNLAGQRGTFLVTREESARLSRFAARRGLRLAGFVHSHSTDLRPSDRDRLGAQASALPWIVATVRDGQLAYRPIAVGTTRPDEPTSRSNVHQDAAFLHQQQ